MIRVQAPHGYGMMASFGAGPSFQAIRSRPHAEFDLFVGMRNARLVIDRRAA